MQLPKLLSLPHLTNMGGGLWSVLQKAPEADLIVGGISAGAALMAVVGEANARQGLECQKAFGAAMDLVRAKIEAQGLNWEDRDTILEADAVLHEHLIACLPSRAELGANALDVELYPIVASRTIVNRIAAKAPLLAEGSPKPLAREFALAAVEHALRAGLQDPRYAALLEIHIVTAMAQALARMEAGQASDRARDEAFQAETDTKLDQVLALLGGKDDAGRLRSEIAVVLELQPDATAADIVATIRDREAARKRQAAELAADPATNNRVRNFEAAAEQALLDSDDAAAIRALEQAEAAINERREEDARQSAKFAAIRAAALLRTGDWEAADAAWGPAEAMLRSFDADAAEKIAWDAANGLQEFGETFAASQALSAAAAKWRQLRAAAEGRQDPERAAGIANNLGNTLATLGGRTGGTVGLDVLAEAVAAYRAALTVLTREAMPAQWATTRNNLGSALQRQGKRTDGAAGLDLLAEAVAAFRAALTVYTQTAMPAQWATTHNNLGVALATQGEWTDGAAGLDLLAKAVATFRAALRVHTQAAMPVDWAMTQNNLGNALRTQGNRTGGAAGLDLLAEAAAAYRAALTVFTAEHFGYQHEIVARNLARTEAMIAKRRGSSGD